MAHHCMHTDIYITCIFAYTHTLHVPIYTWRAPLHANTYLHHMYLCIHTHIARPCIYMKSTIARKHILTSHVSLHTHTHRTPLYIHEEHHCTQTHTYITCIFAYTHTSQALVYTWSAPLRAHTYLNNIHAHWYLHNIYLICVRAMPHHCTHTDICIKYIFAYTHALMMYSFMSYVIMIMCATKLIVAHWLMLLWLLHNKYPIDCCCFD